MTSAGYSCQIRKLKDAKPRRMLHLLLQGGIRSCVGGAVVPGILRKAGIWAGVGDLLLAQVGGPFARHRQQVTIHDLVIG